MSADLSPGRPQRLNDAEVHPVEDVFTPARPARLTFVDRGAIKDKMIAALRTPGKQVVVYGHSGSGKSTLIINTLEETYERQLTTRCTSTMSFRDALLDAFDQLNPHYVELQTSRGSTSSFASVSADYFGIRAKVGATESSETELQARRVVPPQLTPGKLAQLIGSVDACWVLEDFHKLAEAERRQLAQVMKVFMDSADEHRLLRIVAIGAVDTAREVVELEPEMKNRVAEIQVPLMTEAEIRAIPTKGQELLNFRIPEGTIQGITKYSNGQASVCHQLCLNLCRAAGIERTTPYLLDTTPEHMQKAVEHYIDDTSDTLRTAFDKAYRRHRTRAYDNCRIIIEAMARLPEERATHAEILKEIRKHEKEYPASNLTTYLQELQTAERGALIRSDRASGRFQFVDPIYRTYSLVLAERAKQATTKKRGEVVEGAGMDAESFKALLEQILKKVTVS